MLVKCKVYNWNLDHLQSPQTLPLPPPLSIQRDQLFINTILIKKTLFLQQRIRWRRILFIMLITM